MELILDKRLLRHHPPQQPLARRFAGVLGQPPEAAGGPVDGTVGPVDLALPLRAVARWVPWSFSNVPDWT